jgi:Cucumopine synthase C-terminal helical bundle domain
MTWMELKSEFESETEAILFTPPEEILKIFHYQMIDSRAGTNGQAMSAMVFVAGDVRYLAFYGVNNVVKLCDSPDMDIAALRAVARTFIPLSSEFLGYCGLKKVYAFAQDLVEVLDEIEKKEDMRDFLSAFGQYVGTLNGWVQHYFPWNIGTLARQKTPKELGEMARLAAL